MNMTRTMKGLLSIAALATTLLLAACATPGSAYGARYGAPAGYDQAPPARPAPCTYCGVVREVRQVYVQKQSSSTAGTVLGAIIGGVLGNTVGKGDGRKAATVIGAVAGGAVGNRVSRQDDGQELAWQVVVRLDDGRLMTVTQRGDPGVRRGDYVEVRNGHVYPH